MRHGLLNNLRGRGFFTSCVAFVGAVVTACDVPSGCPAGYETSKDEKGEEYCAQPDAGAELDGMSGPVWDLDGGWMAEPRDASSGLDANYSVDGQQVDSQDAADAVMPADANAKPGCVVSAEDCNGKDDDCDGQVDEGVQNACGGCGAIPPAKAVGTPCSNGGQGACALPGAYACLGGTTVCNAPPPTPSPETCDGKDNDCNGQVDEGVKNACGGCGAVPAETCDGKDNDCNGQVDEGVKNACGGCGAVPAETCDGKDNDCNGQVDEGVKNACGGCGAVPVEVCDGQDNDCDGMKDEGVANECGGCGPITAIAGKDPEVSGATIMLGASCSFPQPSGGYKGGKPQGRVNCLTTSEFYCFVGFETCFDSYDNDYDGMVDECANAASGDYTDKKYGGITPLQQSLTL